MSNDHNEKGREREREEKEKKKKEKKIIQLYIAKMNFKNNFGR